MVQAPSDEPRYRIGVDENGLGPRLGPMIVTAILARVTPAGWSVAGKRPRGALAKRLGDSKQLVSHGDVSLAEAWARALVERGCGRYPLREGGTRPADVIEAVSVDDRATLQAPCPKQAESQCWSTETESFEASRELVDTISKDLDKLTTKGVEIVGVRSVVLCTKRLNDGALSGVNRFVLDLHAMERLILEFRRIAGGDIHAVCGKVGGFGRYSDVFGPLGGRLHTILEETRKRSAYRFPGVGEIAFVQDGDDSDLCVGMASMVGKYLREALMARIVSYYQGLVPELPVASGYHDPVTARFVSSTSIVRKRQQIPDLCFERRRCEGEPVTRELT